MGGKDSSVGFGSVGNGCGSLSCIRSVVDWKKGLPKGQIAAGGLELAEKYRGDWVD